MENLSLATGQFQFRKLVMFFWAAVGGTRTLALYFYRILGSSSAQLVATYNKIFTLCLCSYANYSKEDRQRTRQYSRSLERPKPRRSDR